MVSVVVGGQLADGRGCGAAGARPGRRRRGGLKGAAVDRHGLKGTAGGAVALRQRRRRCLEHKQLK